MPRPAVPRCEKLWGLAGATRESFVVRVGDSLVEVMQYVDPVGKPWPWPATTGDIGILNVALGLQDWAALDALVAKGRSTLITGQMLRTLTGGLARQAALARA